MFMAVHYSTLDICVGGQASLSAHNMHHGVYGRGREENEIDCTHYCSHARDVWSTILYNYMCG